jgi:secondary thiamine-phosphate synthase enzyme
MGKVFTINVNTERESAMINITPEVQAVIAESGVKQGICYVFIPHSTAAVTVNENADPDVVRDFIMEINKIVPRSDGYHHCEGNSAAHIKSSLLGVSETVIIEDGKLVLGTWQGVYFLEFDGPRDRKVYVKIIEG